MHPKFYIYIYIYIYQLYECGFQHSMYTLYLTVVRIWCTIELIYMVTQNPTSKYN